MKKKKIISKNENGSLKRLDMTLLIEKSEGDIFLQRKKQQYYICMPDGTFKKF